MLHSFCLKIMGNTRNSVQLEHNWDFRFYSGSDNYCIKHFIYTFLICISPYIYIYIYMVSLEEWEDCTIILSFIPPFLIFIDSLHMQCHFIVKTQNVFYDPYVSKRKERKKKLFYIRKILLTFRWNLGRVFRCTAFKSDLFTPK